MALKLLTNAQQFCNGAPCSGKQALCAYISNAGTQSGNMVNTTNKLVPATGLCSTQMLHGHTSLPPYILSTRYFNLHKILLWRNQDVSLCQTEASRAVWTPWC